MKEKIGVIILGVGIDCGEMLMATNRLLLEMPEEFNKKVQDLFIKEYPTNKDWKQYIVKETDYNYKPIK
jgi:hypothetical protein